MRLQMLSSCTSIGPNDGADDLIIEREHHGCHLKLGIVNNQSNLEFTKILQTINEIL